ncbi:MAG: glycosyltransferase [Armatimonadetes bacterium]|nr:glycosyltransferase [Armatimonadota bacterium]NIM23790.1 glycosyltransferase [Armatimonadota bacterium]NIM67667.1 glycosyltransferase [Armatimonadota bacterium]NIM76183.1 glycosyltransferase [Armatimonadota bacterium]NIN05868.1 glycosyltransferase [Armatimonadota bacterium]
MRIIEVEYLGPPAVGGVEGVVESLSQRFAAKGHTTEIWCTDLVSFRGPRHQARQTTVDSVTVRRFPARRSRLFFLDPYHVSWQGFQKALVEAGRQGAVIHLHPFPSSHAMASLAVLKAGGVVVITPHHEVESLRRYRGLWRGRRTISTLLAAAQTWPRLRLGLHTQLERAFWEEEMGWPKEQMQVIPNGVDLAEFDDLSPDDMETAAARWPAGDIRILFVGRLDPVKGIDTLVLALAHLPKASLLVVGPEAGALAELKILTHELKLEQRVHFSGLLTRKEVCAAFRACDIFVLPSKRGENFGMAAIEAMAAGRPVVVSDCGGLPTLVKQGKNGLIFPRGSVEDLTEALKFLAGSQPARQSFGEAGRKIVESDYTWEIVAQKYLGLFSSAITASKSHAGS